MVDKEAIGLIFLQILQFHPVNMVPPTPYTHISFKCHKYYTILLSYKVVKLKTCHSQNFEVKVTKIQNKSVTKITHRSPTLNCIIDIIILKVVNERRSRQQNTHSSIPERGHRERSIHFNVSFQL